MLSGDLDLVIDLIDFLQKSHFYLAQGGVPILGTFPAAGDCGGGTYARGLMNLMASRGQGRKCEEILTWSNKTTLSL